MILILTKHNNKLSYNKFKNYLIKFKQIDIEVLKTKDFIVQLGFMLEFISTIGYEILANKKGFQITSDVEETKIFQKTIALNKRTLILKENKVRYNIENYNIAIDLLFTELNTIDIPF